MNTDMGDVLSLCCEAFVVEEENFAAPLPKPKDICGREWHVLAKQLKAKRNAAIQASNQQQHEATNNCDDEEAQAKAHQILFLHQAMRSARSAQREQRRLKKMWRDVDRDVLESMNCRCG